MYINSIIDTLKLKPSLQKKGISVLDNKSTKKNDVKFEDNSPSTNDSNASSLSKKNSLNLNIVSDFVVIEYNENETYTEEEWAMILSKKEFIQTEYSRLYASLHQGVPKDLRKRIWLYIANVDKVKEQNYKKGITYQDLIEQECAVTYRIEKDIPRTFPNHEFFMDHRKDRLQHLSNVLKAYAVFDPEVGYTQGMNFLVGTLIYYMHLERIEKDYYVLDQDFESDVFWVLVHIMYEKDWRSLYADNTPKLIVLLEKLETKIQKELPKLYDVFQEHALIPACFSQYFLTMMFYNSPLRFAKRVLDMFLIVGEELISDLIFKMLSLCENEILKKKDVEELYPFLRSQLVQFTLDKHQKEFSNLINEYTGSFQTN